MNGTVAWVLQELPALVGVAYAWTRSPDALKLTPQTVLFALFTLHYFHRTLIFPFRLRGGKPTPVVVCALAFFFCTYNGYMQGQSLLAMPADRELTAPHFMLGLAVFLAGLATNLHSDTLLLNLRRPGETGYKIPRGGAFELVSGANFFGEIVEWFGFALAAWSLPAFAFAIFTFANIGPRAASHHQWYLKKFPDYPRNRRAVIPFVW